MNKPNNTDNRTTGDSWQEEIKEIVSGASGGFLFGIPLLYTMEVWFIGSYVKPPILLAILALTTSIVFVLNRVEGFRPQESDTIIGAVAETVETMAIALVCATIMLVILGRIDWQTSLTEALGKIIFEGVPFALGVAFSRSILSGESQQKSNSSTSSNSLSWKDTVADFSATIIGAVFIGFSIAPTDEVAVLAASASPFRLLLIIAASLFVSYGIVFASTITNYQQRRQQEGLFQSPRSETVSSYIVSLLIGVLMLWFFQKLTLSEPWYLWLRYSIILSLPTSIGGAAGRLAV